ncbi:hypothetical protein LIER_33175 [Lithospermum erythrorhizon]|uniref:RING-type E3 ubiquitin transferase n=1 Tax=Lithospermum erythrorhizon TaxID=34254 RepID=A0AAV3RXC0_LITER
MGAFCSCFRDEREEFSNPNSSFRRNCMCLPCLTQNFFHLYTSLFRRDVHALTPSTQGPTSLSSRSSLDDSIADMYHSPPRPLPYDADPRCFRLQRDGLISRREKGSSHSHEETEPLRRCGGDEDTESVGSKWNESACDQGLKEYDSKISLKFSTAKTFTPYLFPYMYSSSEEEDVCPTCLEEYTEENPKIITKCSHHFHLGCIYEWMERSENCPVCGKVMAFDEPA